jgi:hypothetical protein
MVEPKEISDEPDLKSRGPTGDELVQLILDWAALQSALRQTMTMRGKIPGRVSPEAGET